MLTSGCAAFAGEIQEAVHGNDVSKVKKLIDKNPDLFSTKMRMVSRLYIWRRQTGNV
jgi:hypothetical protein